MPTTRCRRPLRTACPVNRTPLLSAEVCVLPRLRARLAGAKARLRGAAEIDLNVAAILGEHHVGRYLKVARVVREEHHFKHARRGRAGLETAGSPGPQGPAHDREAPRAGQDRARDRARLPQGRGPVRSLREIFYGTSRCVINSAANAIKILGRAHHACSCSLAQACWLEHQTTQRKLRRCGGHLGQVGGHAGGSCRGGGGESLLVRADRLAINPRDPLDLSLAGAGLQQCSDRCLQMRLQDVHSWRPSGLRGRKVTSCSALTSRPCRPDQGLIEARSGWGNSRWPSGGSVVR